MIRVCPNCSNVDVNKLKTLVGEENVKTGCIGQCRACLLYTSPSPRD